MSTGEVGTYSCATIDIGLDDTIRHMTHISKVGISAPAVESLLSASKTMEPMECRMAASLLTKYYKF